MPLIRKMERSRPGEILKIEVIETRNLTLEQSAELLQINCSELSSIFNGQASGIPIAARIADVFGGTAAFWERLQRSFNLDRSQPSSQ